MGLTTDLQRTYIGLATNAPYGAEAFKKIDHDGQKIQLRKLSEHNAPLALELTIIANFTNLFNLYLNTEFTEQTKVFRFFRAFSVQIKTTFMEMIG